MSLTVQIIGDVSITILPLFELVAGIGVAPISDGYEPPNLLLI